MRWYAPRKNLKINSISYGRRHPGHLRQKRTAPAEATASTFDISDFDRYKREKLMLEKLNMIQSLLKQRDVSKDLHQADSNPAVLLDHVLKEVSALKTGAKSGSTNSSDCNIEGQWLSESAGGLFTLNKMVGMSGQERQEMPLERKRSHDHVHNGFMSFKDWNTTLTYPYANNSQYIIINGWNNRDQILATFMGECRVCRKRELLQGNWLIVSHSRDCESLGTTAKLISDVFRRDNIDKLRKQHLSELNTKKNNGKKGISFPKTTNAPASASEPVATEEHTTKKTKSAKPTSLHIKLH
ncbi:uncharacterized protein [Atheta coriaria]|uniref:uncharacterized protein n=1 Tax=Dalotia coriaria TaxID=877792 RepID=UPI0031F45693